MKHTHLIGLATTLAIVGGAQRAHADAKKDKARAKQLYDEGLTHYNLGEYQPAIEAWTESYKLSKSPLLLFNIGQAYRLSGDCSKANTFYDSYQREEPEPANKDELDQALALCKKPDKPVVMDTPIPPPKQPDRPVVAPDKPVVAPLPTPVAHDDGNPGHGKRLAGVVIGAGGLVLGGAGIVFALGAKHAANDLDGFSGEWGDKQIATQNRGKRDQKLAWALGGGGIVALGVGVTLYVMGKGEEHAAPAVAIVPAPDAAGGGLATWTTAF